MELSRHNIVVVCLIIIFSTADASDDLKWSQYSKTRQHAAPRVKRYKILTDSIVAHSRYYRHRRNHNRCDEISRNDNFSQRRPLNQITNRNSVPLYYPACESSYPPSRHPRLSLPIRWHILSYHRDQT